MTVREQIQKGRRPRRKNGEARQNVPWGIKGVERTTQLRVAALAKLLGTTHAGVIDLATKLLHHIITEEDKAAGRKGITLTSEAGLYASLFEKDDAPSNDPAVMELEKRLQRRRKLRDEFMGSGN